MIRASLGRILVAPLCIAVAVAVFAAAAPDFVSGGNLANVAGQMWVLVLLAVGQMFAIASRGFDISVGVVAALAGTVAAIAANQFGFWALAAAPLVGIACGTLNGWLIGRLGLQPIVATLGMLIAAKGVALLISADGQAVPLSDAALSAHLAFDAVLGLPPLGWLALAGVVAAHGLLRHAAIGRRILMLGSNPDAIGLVGADAGALQIRAYQLCGLFAGLAGALMTARAGAGLPTEGSGMELQSIAAAVIGGTALSGGAATVWTVVAGAAFIQVVLTGLNLTGVSPFLAQVAVGAVIVGSGLIDAGLRSLLSSVRRSVSTSPKPSPANPTITTSTIQKTKGTLP
ncbi:ABC transporter permease [Labrys monachus]|uniref:Ribose transport system permease protein n=1 Tax=Labrys monachus TaxID=217067 RepID=A0ABU0F9Z8_9HYPH|nr:ABC transporter permease [Labrys monachus]MDQ0391415.1 ribose transport system permease protein [Labrys monachus]